MIFAWVWGLVVVGIAALGWWLYAPDKLRAALEAAYPGDYRGLERFALLVFVQPSSSRARKRGLNDP